MTVIRVCYQLCLNNSLSKVVQSMTSTFHSTFRGKFFFEKKVSQCRKKPLVSPGTVSYAEKKERPF